MNTEIIDAGRDMSGGYKVDDFSAAGHSGGGVVGQLFVLVNSAQWDVRQSAPYGAANSGYICLKYRL